MAAATYPGGGYPGEYSTDGKPPVEVALTGVSATVARGTVLPIGGDVNVALTGVSATVARGTVVYFVPVPISPATASVLVTAAPLYTGVPAGPTFPIIGARGAAAVTPPSFGGLTAAIKPGSLEIIEMTGQIETIKVQFEDPHGALNFDPFDPISMSQELTSIFIGDISEAEVSGHESPYNVDANGRQGIGPVGARVWTVIGQGLSNIAFRIPTGAFSAQARVSIVQVAETLGALLGVTVVANTYGTLLLPEAFLSEQESVSEALSRLADLATGLSGMTHIWKIAWPGSSFSDPTLYFQPVSNLVSSYSIGIGGYPARAGSIQYRKTREQYANRVILKLDRYLKEGGAEQTETLAGSDIFLGTLSLESPLAGQPTVTVEGTEETVGIKDSDTGKDWYWSLGSSVLSVGDSGASGSDEIIVKYAAHDLRAVESSNTPLIGLHGLYAIPLTSPDSGNTTSPQAQADAELSRRAGVTEHLTLQVLCPPRVFQPGQIIPVAISSLGEFGIGSLGGYFYCSKVRTFDEQGITVWRELTLSRGPMIFSPGQIMRKL